MNNENEKVEDVGPDFVIRDAANCEKFSEMSTRQLSDTVLSIDIKHDHATTRNYLTLMIVFNVNRKHGV